MEQIIASVWGFMLEQESVNLMRSPWGYVGFSNVCCVCVCVCLHVIT